MKIFYIIKFFKIIFIYLVMKFFINLVTKLYFIFVKFIDIWNFVIILVQYREKLTRTNGNSIKFVRNEEKIVKILVNTMFERLV